MGAGMTIGLLQARVGTLAQDVRRVAAWPRWATVAPLSTTPEVYGGRWRRLALCMKSLSSYGGERRLHHLGVLSRNAGSLCDDPEQYASEGLSTVDMTAAMMPV